MNNNFNLAETKPTVMKKFLLSLSIVFICSISFAQGKYSLTVGGGTTFRIRPADGYYYSFNLGIPLGKYFEIAPTFTNATAVTPTFASFHWNYPNNDYLYGYPYEGPKKESIGGDQLSSMSVLILFKPFGGNEKRMYDLGIGAGIGFKQYQSTSWRFNSSESVEYLTLFDIKSNAAIAPYWAKIYLNRKINENTFAGLTLNIDGYDGEGIMFFGAQFGVHF